jgi:hypothetical protein
LYNIFEKEEEKGFVKHGILMECEKTTLLISGKTLLL